MVRAEGVEPPHLTILEPKSSASTSSATRARPAKPGPIARIGGWATRRTGNCWLPTGVRRGRRTNQCNNFRPFPMSPASLRSRSSPSRRNLAARAKRQPKSPATRPISTSPRLLHRAPSRRRRRFPRSVRKRASTGRRRRSPRSPATRRHNNATGRHRAGSGTADR